MFLSNTRVFFDHSKHIECHSTYCVMVIDGKQYELSFDQDNLFCTGYERN